MRTSLALLAASSAAVFAAPPASQTVSYSNTLTVNGTNTYSDLTLSQFNTNLGTLIGVTLTVNEFSIGGTFDATAVNGPGVLNYFGTSAFLRQKVTNSLGFTTLSVTESTDDNLVITPGVGAALTQDVTQQFSITEYIIAQNAVTNVASGFWSAYEGTGSIYLQLKNNPGITMTAPTAQFSGTNATAFADVTVTYTYTPVPEPSTYGLMLGGLALAGAALRRRRKA